MEIEDKIRLDWSGISRKDKAAIGFLYRERLSASGCPGKCRKSGTELENAKSRLVFKGIVKQGKTLNHTKMESWYG